MSMDVAAVGPAAALHAISGASPAAPPQQKMANLFNAIDTTGSGSITKAQFEQAFQSKSPPGVFKQQGADAIFAALDPNGTGSVSKSDFISGMTQLMKSLRAAHVAPAIGSAATSLTTSLQSLGQIGGSAPNPNAPAGSVVNLSA